MDKNHIMLTEIDEIMALNMGTGLLSKYHWLFSVCIVSFFTLKVHVHVLSIVCAFGTYL